VATYVATVAHMSNGGAGDDNTTRRYIRQVEGEEESAVATANDANEQGLPAVP
jgi:hypothetical protein